MNFDVSAFNKLRPHTFITFKKEPRKSIPKRINNPMGAIVIFARFMELTYIPVETVEKLRTDPYFKYCFYILKRHGSIYDKTSTSGRSIRERLVTLLKKPSAMTDEDLFHGLLWYLNNFTHYMPGGMYRQPHEEGPEFGDERMRIIGAVDAVLQEKGIPENEAHSLFDAFRKDTQNEIDAFMKKGLRAKETSFANRINFFKLCLEVFNILFERYHFDPQALWT